jgi:Uma2 family endonuclease
MIRAPQKPHTKGQERYVVDQRLLLHNVSWDDYETIGEALRDRPALRLTYDRGNLEIYTTSSPSAPLDWTSDAHRLLLHDIDWPDYEALLQALEGQHLRTTYDRGSMEFMTLSPEHELYRTLLHLFIQILAEEFQIPQIALGMITCRRQELERGLEPDDCFYIKNWKKIRGKKRLDLRVDPSPDLAIEIDITRSSLNRMTIYAKLRVGEVWRFDGETLRIHVLDAHGEYRESRASPTFPTIPVKSLTQFLKDGIDQDQSRVGRAFRAWVRKHRRKKES